MTVQIYLHLYAYVMCAVVEMSSIDDTTIRLNTNTKYEYCYYIFYFFYQLHAVSRSRQGRQREPSVMTLHFPLSAKIWRHWLSGGIQRRALSRHQGEEMKI